MPDNPIKNEKKNNPKNLNPTERDPKERAINPLAVRPEGMNVTFKKEDKVVNKMSKLFGF